MQFWKMLFLLSYCFLLHCEPADYVMHFISSLSQYIVPSVESVRSLLSEIQKQLMLNDMLRSLCVWCVKICRVIHYPAEQVAIEASLSIEASQSNNGSDAV